MSLLTKISAKVAQKTTYLSCDLQQFKSFPAIFKVLGEELPLDKFKFTSADIDIF